MNSEISGDKFLQAEETADAKALRLDYHWSELALWGL